MKYRELTPKIIRTALQTYLLEAYPKGVPERVRIPTAVWTAENTDEMLGAFTKERVARDRDATSEKSLDELLKKYVLRLGNERYPFMKFLVHESYLEGEFVFGVDTHDNMDIRPHFPDYEEWQKLRKYNDDLRARIESKWQKEHLDTSARLIERMKALPVRQNGYGAGLRALVVDNEVNLAQLAACILRSEGFSVDLAGDGLEAIEKLKAKKYHVVVTDYEMPKLDGLQLLDRMHADPDLASIPALLTSSRQLPLLDVARATLFLSKPYSPEALLGFVESLLRKKGRS
jgi:CheY-like chemotaxis protein